MYNGTIDSLNMKHLARTVPSSRLAPSFLLYSTTQFDLSFCRHGLLFSVYIFKIFRCDQTLVYLRLLRSYLACIFTVIRHYFYSMQPSLLALIFVCSLRNVLFDTSRSQLSRSNETSVALSGMAIDSKYVFRLRRQAAYRDTHQDLHTCPPSITGQVCKEELWNQPPCPKAIRSVDMVVLGRNGVLF